MYEQDGYFQFETMFVYGLAPSFLHRVTLAPAFLLCWSFYICPEYMI